MRRRIDRRFRAATLVALVQLAITSCAMAQAEEADHDRRFYCVVEPKLDVGLAANHNVSCSLQLSRYRKEVYHGYTGVTGIAVGKGLRYLVAYDVVYRSPQDLATLDGNFDIYATLGGGPTNALIGGRSHDTLLLPVEDVSGVPALGAGLIILNKLAGLGYLHLVYGGVVSTK